MIDPELSSFGDFRFDDWLVQPRLNRITRSDSTVTLEPKVMQVLVCLAENAGDLVPRQELIDAVWATEFISENILTRAVAELRNALGDDAKDPRYIETIHRSGYRLILPVVRLGGEDGEPITQLGVGKRGWPHALAVGIAAIIGLLVIFPPEALFERGGGEGSDPSLPRIVVLPFENLGPPEDEYFADGMTEEITSRLTSVSGLGVISRTSAMQYKERRPSIREIAENLKVDYVLEGTVRWERGPDGPGRVRITPQLVQVDEDTHLWSERYDRVMEAVFTVQADIAQKVVERLHVVLLEPEKATLEMRPTNNLEAYQAYLLALHHGFRTQRTEDIELAVGLFERTVELDPNFALAYAGLAAAQSKLIHYRADNSLVRRAKAKEAAEKALALGPDLPEVHRARGFYYYWAFRDYERALSEFALAAAGKPGDGRVWAGIGLVLRRQGQMNDASAVLEKALAFDPQNATLIWHLGTTYALLGRHEEAVENIERALSIAPDLTEPYGRLALTYRLWDGSPERARAALQSIPDRTHPFAVHSWLVQEIYERKYTEALDRLRTTPVSVFELQRKFLPASLIECECFLALNQSENADRACENARELLNRALDDQPNDPRIHSALGKTYALLGRYAEAIHHGEEAVDIWPVGKDAIDGMYFEVDLAEIYALADKPESVIAKLEYLFSIPSMISAADLRFNPKWDPLRDHPRFRAFLEEYDTN